MTKKVVNLLKSQRVINIFLLTISLSFLAVSCAPTRYEITNKDIMALKDLWLKNIDVNTRKEIIKELERRKATDALIYCFILSKNTRYFKKDDQKIKKISLDIIEAIGRLKDPSAIEALATATGYSKGHSQRIADKETILAILHVFIQINDEGAVQPTIQLLKNSDGDIRWEALETLRHFKNSETVEAIYPILFDDDHILRCKAAHTLGEIGSKESIEYISLLLADKNGSVKRAAELALKKLDVSEGQIKEWEDKAANLSIEDVYQSTVAHQKALIEKKALKEKLKSEADIKKQLKDSLKSYETSLKKQQELVASLYEKERQLKSKLLQLEIAKKQLESSQKKLKKLEAEADKKNQDLINAQSKKSSTSIRDELDNILQAKAQLEEESKYLQNKEAKLRDDIINLKNTAEKARIETENAKMELAVMRDRETKLITQVDDLKKRLNRGLAPVLVISKPKDGSKIESPFIMLHLIAVDDRGISRLDATLNNVPIELDTERGVEVKATHNVSNPKKIDITKRLQLQYGKNKILVAVMDTDGITSEEMITIVREKEHGDIWAIVIGINQYQNTRNLKYAVNDAKDFKDYLREYIGIPDEKIFFYTDKKATKDNIERMLGTHIKRKAAKDDTVIIFYAGHGAVETDPSNPDGDGFEKYLLPYNAELEDLYTTSISMDDIQKIFQRIRSDRLIFIADTCYSGASGGRTMLASKARANLSENFFDRIAKGKGRVIISSCSANEISKEDDKLKHGIFSYYLLEGLKGKADHDTDGIITVSELFSFLSREVPKATGQDQHPVRKGETEGELVIGRVK